MYKNHNFNYSAREKIYILWYKLMFNPSTKLLLKIPDKAIYSKTDVWANYLKSKKISTTVMQ